MLKRSGEPQSNQRGIETIVHKRVPGAWWNGLNRTSVGLKPGMCLEIQAIQWLGLNRTSVGLKPVAKLTIPVWLVRPQSNQRGIETQGPDDGHPGPHQGLNRTSVGLKQQPKEGPKIAQWRASIEPAWD